MKTIPRSVHCGCLLLALIANVSAADPPASLRSISRTVTVGPDSGDIKGSDSFAPQKAADRLASMAPEGRGLLKILPGTYTMFDSLHVRVPMTIRGEGGKTILKKCPQFVTALTETATVDAVELKVNDASGFKLGYGLTLRPEKEKTAWSPVMRTVVAIRDNTIRIERPPHSEAVYGRPDRAYATASVVQSSFPIIAVRGVNDVEIEDLIADGNLAENMDMYIDGCRNGALYFHQGKDHAVRRCVVRDFNGDGISWQTTHNMLVEEVDASGMSYGLHPGTGSLNSVIRNCRSHHNRRIGLFVCWNVRHGVFENNMIENNGTHGISIGHNDTDNLFVGNHSRSNGATGVTFRRDGPLPDRCVFRANIIEDNGGLHPPGVGFDLNHPARGTVLEDNLVRDTRPAGQRSQTIALRLHPKSEPAKVADSNRFEGAVQKEETQDR
jgi:hypothetical protein